MQHRSSSHIPWPQFGRLLLAVGWMTLASLKLLNWNTTTHYSILLVTMAVEFGIGLALLLPQLGIVAFLVSAFVAVLFFVASMFPLENWGVVPSRNCGCFGGAYFDTSLRQVVAATLLLASVFFAPRLSRR